jgi:tetratricopeptide (TPR) repeat protein
MKYIFALLWALLLAGCATTSPPMVKGELLHDELFAAPSKPIDAGAVFRISDEMRLFLQQDFAKQPHSKGYAQSLYDALYDQKKLKLEYDASETRTASEAFAARSGNCLSLVIMTASLAKELGMFVFYQGVSVEENWLRKGDVYFSSGHVNITLGRTRPYIRDGFNTGDLLTIDFSPLSADSMQFPWRLEESTIIAMYMNNRAAEIIAEGRIAEAYWWAREAIRHDEKFMPSYLSLGVIYRRSGHANHAEAVLRNVLLREPDNVSALANLTIVLSDLGRNAEIAEISQRLKRLAPFEPYHFYALGQEAMREKNYLLARDMFAREVNRQPYNHEFHFALALAHIALGERQKAVRHLSIARETSVTPKEQGIYAAKLNRIRGQDARETGLTH